MTIEQRLEQVEQQNQKIQRTNKRLTVALTMTVVAMAAVVTMAATYTPPPGDKDAEFDTVTARHINVRNHTGDTVVTLKANPIGDGLVRTMSAKGKDLVKLTSTFEGEGTVKTYHPNGKDLVQLSANDNGGGILISNKTGDKIANMYADINGNGVVGAYNRKGEGRTLQPGP